MQSFSPHSDPHCSVGAVARPGGPRIPGSVPGPRSIGLEGPFLLDRSAPLRQPGLTGWRSVLRVPTLPPPVCLPQDRCFSVSRACYLCPRGVQAVIRGRLWTCRSCSSLQGLSGPPTLLLSAAAEQTTRNVVASVGSLLYVLPCLSPCLLPCPGAQPLSGLSVSHSGCVSLWPPPRHPCTDRTVYLC